MRFTVWICLLTILVIFVVSCAPKVQEVAPEATDNVSEEAVAKEETCTDSDDGNNVLLTGTTSKGDVSETDSCSSADKVVEFYCKDNEVQSALTPCPAGLECKDGSCAVKPAEVVKPAGSCVDSDNGKKYDVLGVTVKGSESRTDSCDGANVVEYYCDNDAIKSKTLACPSGLKCKAGVCVTPSCVDSDGKDWFTAGKVTWNQKDLVDSCLNSTELVESVCSKEETFEKLFYSCGEGYECAMGACVGFCRDTDLDDPIGGIYFAGTVTLGNEKKSDYCLNEVTVVDYDCSPDGKTILYTENNVGQQNGFRCKDGALAESCTETDGGKNYSKAGTNYEGLDVSKSDNCWDETYLNEYYCDPVDPSKGMYVEKYKCPYGCSNGYCKPFIFIPKI